MITPLVVYGLFTTILTLAVVCIEDDELLASVTPASASLDKFYVEMKRLHSVRELESDILLDDICTAVLNSAHFFYHHEIRPISFSDEWVKSQLENHTDPYLPVIQDYYKDDSNRYVTITFTHLGEEIKEEVIACGAKKRRSETFLLYYISNEYDFGCTTEAVFCNKHSHTGRFIFDYDKKANMEHLVGLAENPVTVFKFELQERKYNETVLLANATERVNTRCNHLTSFEKLRLCSMALNAEIYMGTILFLSREEDVQPQCEKMDLFYPYIRRGKTRYDKFQNVSVFKCAAKFMQSGTSADFFISLGNEDHTFLISRRKENRMLIEGYFYSYNSGILSNKPIM